jgi:beta-glucosidase
MGLVREERSGPRHPDEWKRQVGAVLDGWMPPRDLFFGAGCAGYQCEGGFNGKGQPQNQFAHWEDARQPSGPATRFWDSRWKDDLDLAHNMSLSAFRMSVEWARLFPSEVRERHPRPEIDTSALDHYATIVLGGQNRGLEPIVTLHHFAHPGWLGVDAWVRDDSADEFLYFVETVVRGLNQRLVSRGGRPVRWWITFNEPNTYLSMTYSAALFPSETSRAVNMVRPANMVRAADIMFAAHVRAYDLIHRLHAERGWAKPRVGLNPIMLDAYGLSRGILDLLGARDIESDKALDHHMQDRARSYHVRLERMQRFGKAGFARHVAAVVRRMSRLPYSKLRRVRQALKESPHSCPMDYVGFDLYDPLLENFVWPPYSAVETWTWRHHPETIYESAHALGDIIPDLPLFVMENGMAIERPMDGPPRARKDGWTRDRFLREHVLHFLQALKEGVPLCGYLHWAISDNFEWGSFTPRFGLHAVDYQDPERPRLPTDAAGTDAAGAYRAITTAVGAGDSQRLFDALTAVPEP